MKEILNLKPLLDLALGACFLVIAAPFIAALILFLYAEKRTRDKEGQI